MALTWITKDAWKSYLLKCNDCLSDDESKTIMCNWVDDVNKLLIPSDLPNHVQELVKTHNKKINTAINSYEKVLQAYKKGSHTNSVVLHLVTWDWVLCYGEGNFFDLTTIKDQVCLLGGANATGKSSFLDVICIGLFGMPSSSRTSQIGTKTRMFSSLANNTRPVDKPMTICVRFSVNGEMYEIHREYDGKDKRAKIVSVACSSTREEGEGSGVSDVAEGLTAVDTWITNNVGSLDDLHMSNMIVQTSKDGENFMYFKYDQQKAYLDRALSLEQVTAFGKIVKEAAAGYAAVNNSLKTAYTALKESISLDALDPGENQDIDTQKCMSDLAKMKEDIELLQTKREQLGKLCVDIKRVKGCVDDYDTLKKQLKACNKKLESFTDLSQHDKEHALVLKGEHYHRLTQLEEKKAVVGDRKTCVSFDDIQQRVNELKEAIDNHNLNKPIPCMSEDMLKKKESEYKRWCKLQKPDYLEDPDLVEEARNNLMDDISAAQQRLSDLQQNPVDEPVVMYDVSRDINDNMPTLTISEYQAKMDSIQQIEDSLVKLNEHMSYAEKSLPRKPYVVWKKEYDAWLSEVADVAEHVKADEKNMYISGLQSRYDQYISYIEVMTEKQKMQSHIVEQLKEVQSECDSIETTPFNPDCWACQQQPMRMRKVHLSDKVASLKKSLSKITKYIESAGEFDMQKLKNDAKQIKILLDKAGYYNATAPQKLYEKDKWDGYHTLKADIVKHESSLDEIRKEVCATQLWAYNKWKKRVSVCKEKIAHLESEIADVQRFLVDLPRYTAMKNLIDEEYRTRDSLRMWEVQYNAMQEETDECKLEMDRILLAEEIEEVQSIMSINTEALDRLKLWTTCLEDKANIEAQIAAVEYTEVVQALEEKNKAYLELRSTLMSLEKTRDMVKNHKDMVSIYESAITVIGKKVIVADYIEGKFVGDRSTSDGFKEYIYQSELVPMFQQYMNDFLQRFETFTLNITYIAKAFEYYIVQGNNNVPVPFDMLSGYQKFVIGLATRAALAKMNAVGHSFKHMFIDEGFVACDADNALKTGTVIKALKEFMKSESIILMSHSDIVKSFADVIVPITMKKEPYSSSVIQWGEPPIRICTPVVVKKRIVKKDKDKDKGKNKELRRATPKRSSRTLNLDMESNQ